MTKGIYDEEERGLAIDKLVDGMHKRQGRVHFSPFPEMAYKAIALFAYQTSECPYTQDDLDEFTTYCEFYAGIGKEKRND